MKEISKSDWRPFNFTGRVSFELSKGIFEFTHFYYVNGILHRTDGPAVSSSVAAKNVFYLNNMCYSKEEWFSKLTEEEKLEALWNIEEWNK